MRDFGFLPSSLTILTMYLQERIDKVAEAKLPIWITEFSIEESDETRKGKKYYENFPMQ